MSSKTCSKCGVEKDVSEFNKNKNNKDGLQFWCKLCRKEHYKNNSDEIKFKNKKWSETNKEKKRDTNKKWREANSERLRVQSKQWREANREEILTKKKEYRETNRDEINAKRRTSEARARRNALRRTPENRANERKRYKEDPLFRIVNKLRARVRQALKAQGAKKFTSTMDLIGCSPEFLTKYLEKQINPGTKREDYHVDHIEPCALFDLTKEEEQKMCFHWTNLQLLLGPANMSKSDDVFWCGQVYKPDEVPPEIREAIYAHCRSNMTLRSS